MTADARKTTSRTDVVQKPPPVDIDLTGFPRSTMVAARMYRAHARRHGAWFFSSHPRALFNLREPKGTCYFAPEVETAVREMFGPLVAETNSVSAALAAEIYVSVVQPPADAIYAHVSARGAARFGITSELTTMGDYALTRRWAQLFDEHHFDGIRYASRFAPGSESWALFGPAGPSSSFGVDELSGMAGTAALEAAGIHIDPPPPRKGSVRIVPDPGVDVE